MKDAVAAVLAELRRDQGFLIDLTQQLVRIPTVNPRFELHPALNHDADLQFYLRAVADGFGMHTETSEALPGRSNLVAWLPGNEARSLILYGQVDVVPVGDRGEWQYDPFAATIANGRLYGRGALDMKGGLAAAVAVARAIRSSGVALDGRLDLHAVVDGEAAGAGVRDLLRRGRRAAGLIVTHATGQALMPAQGGLEWVRVTFRGRGTHAAWRYNELYPQPDAPDRPEPGVNALEIATRFVTAVQQLERDWTTRKRAHPLMPPGANTIHPGVMQCGAGLAANGLPQGMGNPSVVPDVAAIDFSLKFMPDEISADIRDDFERFVHHFAQQDSWLRDTPPRVQWDLHGLHFPPLNTPTDHPLVRAIVDSRAALGEATAIKGFTAVCDAAHYAGAGIPGVIFGPTGGGLHGPNEYVDIASLLAVAETLAAAAVRWCGVA